jgi:hypothetical protein
MLRDDFNSDSPLFSPSTDWGAGADKTDEQNSAINASFFKNFMVLFLGLLCCLERLKPFILHN